MKIQKSVLRKIDIPFSISFKHSAAERLSTDSVLVEMTSDSGEKGYGESCPRHYVTGEDIESVAYFFHKYINSIRAQVDSLPALRNWMELNESVIDENPAAMCAIELAILDLLAKKGRVSVEKLLDLPELQGQFKYSAVLGDSSTEVFQRTLRMYLGLGFDDFKIKLSGNLSSDQEKCRIVSDNVPIPVRVRFDANNLWEGWKPAVDHLSKLQIKYFSVEEPISARDYIGMEKIAQSTGKKIILDESFSRSGQVGNICGHPEQWLVNLRVSKMGGILRSLMVVDRARDHGVKLIIGAHVGETSLLTRAALTVASYAKGLLVAQEGAFGDFLLERDICSSPVMFGRRGTLCVSGLPHSKSGFGIEVDKPHQYPEIPM